MDTSKASKGCFQTADHALVERARCRTCDHTSFRHVHVRKCLPYPRGVLQIMAYDGLPYKLKIVCPTTCIVFVDCACSKRRPFVETSGPGGNFPGPDASSIPPAAMSRAAGTRDASTVLREGRRYVIVSSIKDNKFFSIEELKPPADDMRSAGSCRTVTAGLRAQIAQAVGANASLNALTQHAQ